ncbi:MAG: Pls/PosA family non-ribosomal peptide synthetase [Mariniphaga sp.]
MKYKNILKTDVSPIILTSAVIVLFNKYASYISDSITINIRLNERTISCLTEVISQSTFFADFQHKIKRHLNGECIETIVPGDRLTIGWITENEQGESEHQMILTKITPDIYSIDIQTIENSFYTLVFKNIHVHLQTFINSITTNSAKTISQINYISEHEKEIIRLYSTGHIDNELKIPELLHHLFEQTARNYFNNAAIISQEGNLSYNELNKKADKLAIILISKGLNPGDFVGLLLRRSPELYISLLAVLKAGGAYVPLDIAYPEDRINYILKDCSAKLLISNSDSYSGYENLKCPSYTFDKNTCKSINTRFSAESPQIIQSTQSPAYLIYTSGSTGRPKGVIISHASASHLVKAENKIFKLNDTDRVAQGFSVAFDASVEEIWLAFRSGAALVPVKEQTMNSGEELSQFIFDNQITVLSTVPTMLSMMQDPLPSMRLLILGGECCCHELLQRWHHPRLRIVNTYGPTEATVIATFSEFNPGRRITIGKPILNYCTYILDANLSPVAIGVPGELCIAGAGLALGYLNNEKLTNEKFIAVKIDPEDPDEINIYRTGDLVRMNHEGEIEFLGRIDSQVKIRGYRIELSEIESQLIQLPEVKNAVVVVKEDVFKVQQLIAYVILKINSKPFDEIRFKQRMKEKMADYMVPGSFVELAEFPLLQCGKVDRKKLPEPIIQINNKELKTPKNKTEEAIHKIWSKYFPLHQISVSDDFFELGGHSLLAALTVSEMRKNPDFRTISVQDIYKFRTIEKLAHYISSKVVRFHSNPAVLSKVLKEPKSQLLKTVSGLTRRITAGLQLLFIYLLYIIGTVGLLIPYLLITKTTLTLFSVVVIIIASLFFWLIFFIVISIIAKWVIIGRFKEGRYPLWGWYYLRFWIVKKFVDLAPIAIFCGTPFINGYYRLMGARIGKGVYMGSNQIRIFDLTEVGDNSSISRQANLLGYHVEDGELIIGRIAIGSHCFVGACSVISINSELKNNASIGELSLLSSGEVIPENETWQGSPAEKTTLKNRVEKPNKPNQKALPYPIYMLFHSLAIIFMMIYPMLLMIPFPIIFYEFVDHLSLSFALLSIIPGSLLYILLFHTLITILKWIIIGKSKEEDFSIYSFRYVQKWTVDMLIGSSLTMFRSIYATIYLAAWLRSVGVKIGIRSEISTVNQLNTDLLEIGPGSFLADSITIGTPEVRNKIMSVRKISVGEKTFLGNSAVISCGEKIGNNVLIGVLSTTIHNETESCKDGTSWLGSPPMFLPQRQQSEKFPDKLTYNPTLGLYLKRGFIELIKVTITPILMYLIISLYILLLVGPLKDKSLLFVAFISPLILILFFITTAYFTAFAKRILIGRYKPSNKPLWSMFVWKNELVNSLCESMVYPTLVGMTMGTPFASWFFRLMGVKVGKNVYFETTEITEFDLVSIGDNVSLNHRCTIQTHLFEDRVMKMSTLNIGDNCNVGSMSVVLYDSVMENNSSISALSLVMKGEVIQQGTKWAGSPAKFIGSI